MILVTFIWTRGWILPLKVDVHILALTVRLENLSVMPLYNMMRNLSISTVVRLLVLSIGTHLLKIALSMMRAPLIILILRIQFIAVFLISLHHIEQMIRSTLLSRFSCNKTCLSMIVLLLPLEFVLITWIFPVQILPESKLRIIFLKRHCAAR